MIYYFSGTGNSRAVALQLASLLTEEICDMCGKSMTCSPSSETIGLVFPVHAWGMPREVERFIRTMTVIPSSYCFAVLTCGDDCGLAAEDLCALLQKQNVRLHYAASVCMPNTYVPLPFFDIDSSQIASRKLEEASRHIHSISLRIKARTTDLSDVRRGSLPRLKSRLLRPLFRRLLATPRHFFITADCIRCGRCATICPLGNIDMSNGSPRHGTDCTDCLACYHVCPRHAVMFTRFTRGKGQYLHPETGTAYLNNR